MMKLFLIVAGVFLLPVALSYGVDPAVTIPKFMNFTVDGTDQTHRTSPDFVQLTLKQGPAPPMLGAASTGLKSGE